MKRFISTIIISISAMTLVSCGDTKTETETEAEKFTDIYGRTFNVAEFTQLDPLEEGETYAVIETTHGDITVKFLPEAAPLAVENFLTHAENGYYDGLKWHRIIDDFVIQGGDPTGTGAGGESIWGEVFENEVSISARHFAGALAMANSGPDTNGSQFYIVENSTIDEQSEMMFTEFKNDPNFVLDTAEDGTQLFVSDYFPEEVIDGYLELGGAPFLDFGYTVFGQVVEGFDVVQKIADTEIITQEVVIDEENNITQPIEMPAEDVFIDKITVYNN